MGEDLWGGGDRVVTRLQSWQDLEQLCCTNGDRRMLLQPCRLTRLHTLELVSFRIDALHAFDAECLQQLEHGSLLRGDVLMKLGLALRARQSVQVCPVRTVARCGCKCLDLHVPTSSIVGQRRMNGKVGEDRLTSDFETVDVTSTYSEKALKAVHGQGKGEWPAASKRPNVALKSHAASCPMPYRAHYHGGAAGVTISTACFAHTAACLLDCQGTPASARVISASAASPTCARSVRTCGLPCVPSQDHSHPHGGCTVHERDRAMGIEAPLRADQ